MTVGSGESAQRMATAPSFPISILAFSPSSAGSRIHAVLAFCANTSTYGGEVGETANSVIVVVAFIGSAAFEAAAGRAMSGRDQVRMTWRVSRSRKTTRSLCDETMRC